MALSRLGWSDCGLRICHLGVHFCGHDRVYDHDHGHGHSHGLRIYHLHDHAYDRVNGYEYDHDHDYVLDDDHGRDYISSYLLLKLVF